MNNRKLTWQGCPLFIILIEPLVKHIGSDINVKEMVLASISQKVALFKDDILLYVILPHFFTQPVLLSGLNVQLGCQLSALNVSLLKSMYNYIQAQFTFQQSRSTPYLGIAISPSCQFLYEANYPPLVKSFSHLLDTWDASHISWIGCINAVKMSLLSKLLYPFRVLPVPVPPYFLCSLQCYILTFIWGSARPRSNKNLLYKPKSKGRLGVPNISYYYKAAKIALLAQLYTVWHLYRHL